MIRITRPSVTRSCTSGIPWNNTGCPRFRKEELGLRCPWFELEKEKKRREKERREGKGKRYRVFRPSWFGYTTVGLFSTCSTTSDTRYVRQAIPPDDASGVRDIVPWDDNGGGRGGLEKKKTGRVSLTDLSRYRVAQILFKKKKKEKTIHDGKNRLRFGRIDVTS